MKLEKHIDCLRDDYKSIKSEIATRSNLRRYVYGLYMVILGYVFTEYKNANIELLESLWIIIIPIQLFLYRESLEIQKLGSIIKSKISPKLSEIINVDIKSIYHSETNPQRKKWETIFLIWLNWFLNSSIYFFLPLILTSFKDKALCNPLIKVLVIINPTITIIMEIILFNNRKYD